METPPVSADVRLAPSAPEVTPHRDGYVFAPRDVLAAVAACLDGETPAPLRLTRAPAEITTEEMRRRTSRIAAFSTAYADQPNRVHNLRLACRALNATSLAPHAEFGFNAAVGARTAERGYLPAKIIADGAFVEGVGGGVCQVSTTLYNAAMLAGMTQVEVHQHSLSVHYVAPSRDAMVSAWSDMRFVNPYDYPVYLYARAVGGRLTVTVYGAPPEASIALGTTCLVTAPARNVDEAGNVLLSTEGYVLVSAGRDGVSSTLVRTVGMSTHVLRRNTYPEVDAVWRKAPPERPEKGDA